jgi:hypothetical protein
MSRDDLERLRRRGSAARAGTAELNRFEQQLAGVPVIVHDEHVDVDERGRLFETERARIDLPAEGRVGAVVTERQLHGEHGAAALATAEHLDGPAMQLDQVTTDREPEPEPPLSARDLDDAIGMLALGARQVPDQPAT